MAPEPGAVALVSDEKEFQGHIDGLPPDDPRVIVHGRRAERVVAACFIIAFIAGCGFVAAYVGLGVHTVDKTLRSNLALGLSLSVTLLALGLGTLIWVRHLMPNVDDRLPLECPNAGEHFVEQHAGRKNVRSLVGTLALRLFRCGICRGPVGNPKFGDL